MKSKYSSEHFLNRELSAICFNENLLSLAKDENTPLLERLRFLLICSSNLDEFFEIRVAGLKEKLKFNVQKKSIDGLLPEQLLKKISLKCHLLAHEINGLYKKTLIPQLEKENIFFRQPNHNEKILKWAKNYFEKNILPLLNPIGLDIAHPFPNLTNKSLNFIVELDGKDAFGRDSGLAIVHAPRSLDRVIEIPKDIINHSENYIFLSHLIHYFVDKLFPGMAITGCYQCRLTRNSDLYIDDEEAKDLALELKRKLHMRSFGEVVRLEIDNHCPKHIVDFLTSTHQLSEEDVYYYDGPVNLNRYMLIYEKSERLDLKYPPFNANYPFTKIKNNTIFDTLKQKDILLHHPYDSFDSVIEFISQATLCPNVLTIKQTLYRTHAKSAMVQALIEAARAGKEVTAIIELRARFDEESNLLLARELQAAGVVVIYGVVNFKIHAKMSLVVRKEDNTLRRYAHLGTGNYHDKTAKQYEDYGLLTNDNDITSDVLTIFQQITGMGKIQRLKALSHSPFTLAKTLTDEIEKQIIAAKNGKNAEIMIKVNGLTDKKMIKKLYDAANAGVSIKLIIRSLCCLKPNIKNISENIQVISVLGQFLEHSRIYYFKNESHQSLYLSSADLMERNLYHRVETLVPIKSEENIKRISQETFELFFQKNISAFTLDNKGNYQASGQISPQEKLMQRYTKK